MFSKSKKEPGKSLSATLVGDTSASPRGRCAPSIISADLHIVGKITGQGEVHVDGRVDGDIRTRVLLVGDTAHIKGEVVADSVQVHGKVTGRIKAASVSLAPSANVAGDIFYENLSISDGALLEGHCQRMTKPESGEAKIGLLADDGSAVALSLPEPVLRSKDGNKAPEGRQQRPGAEKSKG